MFSARVESSNYSLPPFASRSFSLIVVVCPCSICVSVLPLLSWFLSSSFSPLPIWRNVFAVCCLSLLDVLDLFRLLFYVVSSPLFSTRKRHSKVNRWKQKKIFYIAERVYENLLFENVITFHRPGHKIDDVPPLWKTNWYHVGGENTEISIKSTVKKYLVNIYN